MADGLPVAEESDSLSGRSVASRSGTRARPAASGAATPLVVYVAGEVRRAGVYRFPPGSRIDAALAAAGGAAPSADLVAVNLAETLHDGEEVVVPAKGAAVPPAAGRRSIAVARTSKQRRTRGAKRSRKAPPDGPVDVNTADAGQLETLPGIGGRLAERLVAFREANGPFASPEDLLDVNGVSEHLLDEITPYLWFGSR
jgi:competence protein ComEA